MTRFGAKYSLPARPMSEVMAEVEEIVAYNKAKVRYVVVENDPGCLPESEPMEFEGLDEAQDYIKDVRRQWIEDHGYSPFQIRGSYKLGYYQYGNSRVVEIMEVGE